MSDETRDMPKTPADASRTRAGAAGAPPRDASLDAFLRAENEDDDGYDPYSDRPPMPEPLFERDPWG